MAHETSNTRAKQTHGGWYWGALADAPTGTITRKDQLPDLSGTRRSA